MTPLLSISTTASDIAFLKTCLRLAFYAPRNHRCASSISGIAKGLRAEGVEPARRRDKPPGKPRYGEDATSSYGNDRREDTRTFDRRKRAFEGRYDSGKTPESAAVRSRYGQRGDSVGTGSALGGQRMSGREAPRRRLDERSGRHAGDGRPPRSTPSASTRKRVGSARSDALIRERQYPRSMREPVQTRNVERLRRANGTDLVRQVGPSSGIQSRIVDKDRDASEVESTRDDHGPSTFRRTSTPEVPRTANRGSGHDDMPLSIPYTTASSQFVPGSRAITSILNADKRAAHVLYLSTRLASPSKRGSSLHALVELATRKKVQVTRLEPSHLAAMVTSQLSPEQKRATRGQDLVIDDVVLDCSPLPVRSISALGAHNPSAGFFELEPSTNSITTASTTLPRIALSQTPKPRNPLILWLHELTNTSNIAALARTALFFNISALAISKRATSTLISPASLRASAGALEYLPLLSIDVPKDFISASSQRGWRFYATVPPSFSFRSKDLNRRGARGHGAGNGNKNPILNLADMRHSPVEDGPTVVVMGNEDEGLPGWLVRACGNAVAIGGAGEGRGGVESLNVGVAGGLVLERFCRVAAGDGDGGGSGRRGGGGDGGAVKMSGKERSSMRGVSDVDGAAEEEEGRDGDGRLWS